MSIVKNLPIAYQGELHEVTLVNFMVDVDEVKPLVPNSIPILTVSGKAIISMVDVQLKKMRVKGLPAKLSFDYRHIGFRLLVDDRGVNGGQNQGIFFIQSFTNSSHVAGLGALFTNYNLSHASFSNSNSFKLEQDGKFLEYAIGEKQREENLELKQLVQPIDRAYSVEGTEVQMTTITREKWPIQSVDCTHFKTNFFKTATCIGAFKVFETIPYVWRPAKTFAEGFSSKS